MKEGRCCSGGTRELLLAEEESENDPWGITPAPPTDPVDDVAVMLPANDGCCPNEPGPLDDPVGDPTIIVPVLTAPGGGSRAVDVVDNVPEEEDNWDVDGWMGEKVGGVESWEEVGEEGEREGVEKEGGE
jgi:hypothetical protein